MNPQAKELIASLEKARVKLNLNREELILFTYDILIQTYKSPAVAGLVASGVFSGEDAAEVIAMMLNNINMPTYLKLYKLVIMIIDKHFSFQQKVTVEIFNN